MPLLTRQEVIDHALRYVAQGEIGDFPVEGDLFCIFQRELADNKILKDDEGWKFAGYHICRGYALDDSARPAGKWMWMYYVSLASFPPIAGSFKLQPPHVVKGTFQNPTRTEEFRIVKIDTAKTGPVPESSADEEPASPLRQPRKSGDRPGNILQFPIRKVPKPDDGGDSSPDNDHHSPVA